MIILTGANTIIPRNDAGTELTSIKFTFRAVIEETVQKANECGYTPVVYDLGSLGIGKPFQVDDPLFAEKGHYEKEVIKGYKSKSLFKPAMVRTCVEEHNDLTVYLDGDALLCDSIDEIATDDYDIGVTLRDASELEEEWHQELYDVVKFVNAGVIFFNPTDATRTFLDKWHDLTEEVGNDQMALNQLTCPENYPENYSVHTINGVRVKYFPCKKYNFYYFDEGLDDGIKIMHFKGPVRHYYPIDWKTRLYCKTYNPLKNTIRKLVKPASSGKTQSN